MNTEIVRASPAYGWVHFTFAPAKLSLVRLVHSSHNIREVVISMNQVFGFSESLAKIVGVRELNFPLGTVDIGMHVDVCVWIPGEEPRSSQVLVGFETAGAIHLGDEPGPNPVLTDANLDALEGMQVGDHVVASGGHGSRTGEVVEICTPRKLGFKVGDLWFGWHELVSWQPR